MLWEQLWESNVVLEQLWESSVVWEQQQLNLPKLDSIPTIGNSDDPHTVSSKFFDTQAPSTLIEELVLPRRHARCVLSCLRCNRLAESRILHASVLGPPHGPRTPSHSALSSYGLVPLALWRLSVSVRPLVQILDSFPAYEAP